MFFLSENAKLKEPFFMSGEKQEKFTKKLMLKLRGIRLLFWRIIKVFFREKVLNLKNRFHVGQKIGKAY